MWPDHFICSCYSLVVYKDVIYLHQALKMARKHGLSAAIFAPGWVFENQNKEEFIKNQNK